ncbi:MAG: hypothetical protein ACKVOO_09775 [Burkholderiaceae bacterium]
MTAPPEHLLRRAWAICRCRKWPATYEATMQDPLRAKLVAACATGLATKARSRTSPARSASLPAHQQPGFVDHKRAAAGDFD